MIILRDLQTVILPYLKKPEILVITGMRRTGKTTLLKALYEKIESKNKLFLDLENPLHQKYFEEEDYEKIRFNLDVLGLNLKDKATLFLDEIQWVKKLPQILKYLFDHYGLKSICSGSSSFYLKNLFSESLAGRKYLFELYPLNFTEFLRFKASTIKLPEKKQPVSKAVFDTLSRYYEEYLQFGGFPGVVLKEDFQEKKLTLQDIFSSYYQLEIVQLGDFRKTHVIRDLMLLLMERVGSKLDIQKMASELGVSRPTLYEFLSFLEGTYFIHRVKPFSLSKDVELRGGEKVYICDSGLLNHTARISEGALFENNIFELLKPQGEVNYFQQKGSFEIDFILNKKTAFEVKLNGSQSDFFRLQALAGELKIRKYFLVSKRYTPAKGVLYPFQV